MNKNGSSTRRVSRMALLAARQTGAAMRAPLLALHGGSGFIALQSFHSSSLGDGSRRSASSLLADAFRTTAAAAALPSASLAGGGGDGGTLPSDEIIGDLARVTPGTSTFGARVFDVAGDAPYPLWALDPSGPTYSALLSVARGAADALAVLHDVSGLPWCWAIVAAGVFVRAACLPVVIYSMRNASRAVDAREDLASVARARMTALARLGRAASASDKLRVMRASTSAAAAALHKVGCYPSRSLLAPLASVPILAAGVLGARHAVLTGDASFETGGALWFLDLTVPDPTYALPLAALGISYLSLEVIFSGGRSGRPTSGGSALLGTRIGTTIQSGLQMALIAGVPLLADLPAGLFLLMATNGLWTIAQVLTLRSPAVFLAVTGREQTKLQALPVNSLGEGGEDEEGGGRTRSGSSSSSGNAAGVGPAPALASTVAPSSGAGVILTAAQSTCDDHASTAVVRPLTAGGLTAESVISVQPDTASPSASNHSDDALLHHLTFIPRIGVPWQSLYVPEGYDLAARRSGGVLLTAGKVSTAAAALPSTATTPALTIRTSSSSSSPPREQTRPKQSQQPFAAVQQQQQQHSSPASSSVSSSSTVVDSMDLRTLMATADTQWTVVSRSMSTTWPLALGHPNPFVLRLACAPLAPKFVDAKSSSSVSIGGTVSGAVVTPGVSVVATANRASGSISAPTAVEEPRPSSPSTTINFAVDSPSVALSSMASGRSQSASLSWMQAQSRQPRQYVQQQPSFSAATASSSSSSSSFIPALSPAASSSPSSYSLASSPLPRALLQQRPVVYAHLSPRALSGARTVSTGTTSPAASLFSDERQGPLQQQSSLGAPGQSLSIALPFVHHRSRHLDLLARRGFGSGSSGGGSGSFKHTSSYSSMLAAANGASRIVNEGSSSSSFASMSNSGTRLASGGGASSSSPVLLQSAEVPRDISPARGLSSSSSTAWQRGVMASSSFIRSVAASVTDRFAAAPEKIAATTMTTGEPPVTTADCSSSASAASYSLPPPSLLTQLPVDARAAATDVAASTPITSATVQQQHANASPAAISVILDMAKRCWSLGNVVPSYTVSPRTQTRMLASNVGKAVYGSTPHWPRGTPVLSPHGDAAAIADLVEGSTFERHVVAERDARWAALVSALQHESIPTSAPSSSSSAVVAPTAAASASAAARDIALPVLFNASRGGGGSEGGGGGSSDGGSAAGGGSGGSGGGDGGGNRKNGSPVVLPLSPTRGAEAARSATISAAAESESHVSPSGTSNQSAAPSSTYPDDRGSDSEVDVQNDWPAAGAHSAASPFASVRRYGRSEATSGSESDSGYNRSAESSVATSTSSDEGGGGSAGSSDDCDAIQVMETSTSTAMTATGSSQSIGGSSSGASVVITDNTAHIDSAAMAMHIETHAGALADVEVVSDGAAAEALAAAASESAVVVADDEEAEWQAAIISSLQASAPPPPPQQPRRAKGGTVSPTSSTSPRFTPGRMQRRWRPIAAASSSSSSPPSHFSSGSSPRLTVRGHGISSSVPQTTFHTRDESTEAADLYDAREQAAVVEERAAQRAAIVAALQLHRLPARTSPAPDATSTSEAVGVEGAEATAPSSSPSRRSKLKRSRAGRASGEEEASSTPSAAAAAAADDITSTIATNGEDLLGGGVQSPFLLGRSVGGSGASRRQTPRPSLSSFSPPQPSQQFPPLPRASRRAVRRWTVLLRAQKAPTTTNGDSDAAATQQRGGMEGRGGSAATAASLRASMINTAASSIVDSAATTVRDAGDDDAAAQAQTVLRDSSLPTNGVTEPLLSASRSHHPSPPSRAPLSSRDILGFDIGEEVARIAFGPEMGAGNNSSSSSSSGGGVAPASAAGTRRAPSASDTTVSSIAGDDSADLPIPEELARVLFGEHFDSWAASHRSAAATTAAPAPASSATGTSEAASVADSSSVLPMQPHDSLAAATAAAADTAASISDDDEMPPLIAATQQVRTTSVASSLPPVPTPNTTQQLGIGVETGDGSPLGDAPVPVLAVNHAAAAASVVAAADPVVEARAEPVAAASDDAAPSSSSPALSSESSESDSTPTSTALIIPTHAMPGLSSSRAIRARQEMLINVQVALALLHVGSSSSSTVGDASVPVRDIASAITESGALKNVSLDLGYGRIIGHGAATVISDMQQQQQQQLMLQSAAEQSDGGGDNEFNNDPAHQATSASEQRFENMRRMSRIYQDPTSESSKPSSSSPAASKDRRGRRGGAAANPSVQRSLQFTRSADASKPQQPPAGHGGFTALMRIGVAPAAVPVSLEIARGDGKQDPEVAVQAFLLQIAHAESAGSAVFAPRSRAAAATAATLIVDTDVDEGTASGGVVGGSTDRDADPVGAAVLAKEALASETVISDSSGAAGLVAGDSSSSLRGAAGPNHDDEAEGVSSIPVVPSKEEK